MTDRWIDAATAAPRDAPGRPSLSIRAKILIHQAVVAGALLGTAAVGVLVVDRIGYLIDRNRVASQQVGVAVRLSADLNRHSENVAELLLLGRSEQSELDEARAAVERGIATLARLAAGELALLRSSEEAEEEAEETRRIERIAGLYRDVDGSVDELLALRDAGRADEAASLFRTAVEDGASDALDGEIEALVGGEIVEVQAIRDRTDRLIAILTGLLVAVAAAAVGVSVWAGGRLSRDLGRPIQALVSGTQALREGDLGHRIDDRLPREFADLAREFNAASRAIEAERDRLLARQAGLETEVAARTGELEEANARLQRLDQMRMLFLADISHELRTPLTVLRGEAEVGLRSDRSVEEHRATLERVAGHARAMGRLVDDLLFLARAEVGAVRFEMEPIVLQELVDVALADAAVLAEARGLGLRAEQPEAPLRLSGDQGRLVQALTIVLDNAVKYSDGTAPVEVTLVRDGPSATIRVANRGPGIAPADLPFVFHRFYRGAQDGEGKRDGSGLGLPIAKWVAEAHGGTIAIDSGGGLTVVSLRLPLRP